MKNETNVKMSAIRPDCYISWPPPDSASLPPLCARSPAVPSIRGSARPQLLYPVRLFRVIRHVGHRVKFQAAILSTLAGAMMTTAAEAHLVTTGLGPIYDGISHVMLG